MNKRLVILGAGESGVGAAILGQKQGFDVFVSDMGEVSEGYKCVLSDNRILYEEQGHTEDLILNADLIVKSPGIPDNAPLIIKASEKAIEIISEIEFAFRFTDAKIIAITGSNGKTTTSLLIYHLLESAHYNVGIAGNIGDSFALQVANKSHEYYVLELSSFQLDGINSFKPDVSVMTNITPDHLDRYENDFNKYIASKFQIVAYQNMNDAFIYSGDDKVITEYLNVNSIDVKKIAYSIKEKENSIRALDFSNLKIKGKHNKANAMGAALAVKCVGMSNDKIQNGLDNFEPVEHRLQRVMMVDGVEFINDSKATNVDAVYYALESMEKPVIWIAGGVDKGNDYSALYKVLDHVKALVCLGVNNEKLTTTFLGRIRNIVEADSMSSAVSQAAGFADIGDCVLMSPACASFDLFQNYEDRGVQFIKEVEKLNVKAV